MVERGQIWWIEADEPSGSEPGYRRPVVIVQADTFNRSHIQTVMAVVLTTNLRLAQAPGNVSLPKAKTGLTKASVANVSQIITLDKRSLTEVAGRLDAAMMRQINTGMRLVLAL